jgi:hypothetical protein
MCDHLHESTSRYDAAAKVLTFLLVCPTCGIERVVETLEYEPRPAWTSWATAQRQPGVPELESSIPLEVTKAERQSLVSSPLEPTTNSTGNQSINGA